MVFLSSFTLMFVFLPLELVFLLRLFFPWRSHECPLLVSLDFPFVANCLLLGVTFVSLRESIDDCIGVLFRYSIF